MLYFAIVCAIAANSCKLAIVYKAMYRMLKLEACTIASGAVNKSGAVYHFANLQLFFNYATPYQNNYVFYFQIFFTFVK
jgi:hypothetical protein